MTEDQTTNLCELCFCQELNQTENGIEVVGIVTAIEVKQVPCQVQENLAVILPESPIDDAQYQLNIYAKLDINKKCSLFVTEVDFAGNPHVLVPVKFSLAYPVEYLLVLTCETSDGQQIVGESQFSLKVAR